MFLIIMHEVSLGGINDFGKQKQLNKLKNYWSQKNSIFCDKYEDVRINIWIVMSG